VTFDDALASILAVLPDIDPQVPQSVKKSLMIQ
jgi:hypothetical protein